MTERMRQMRSDIEDHGEVHVIVDEHDGELDWRKGQTTFDFQSEVVAVYDGTTEHFFDFDNIIRWYEPYSVFD